MYVTGSAIARTNAHTGISVCQTYTNKRPVGQLAAPTDTPITST